MSLHTYSEAEFTRQVLQLAKLHGWRSAHFRPGLNRRGKWQTAVAGDGKGFLDLILVRDADLLFVELKVGRGRTTPEQEQWIAALLQVTLGLRPVRVAVWRPEDWNEILRVLSR